MTAKEAVERFVHDGDTVVSANFISSPPFALTHEIMRQRKKDLTIVKSSALVEIDQLIAAGCVKKVMTAYIHRGPVHRYASPFERAIKEKTIEFEDYSNWTIAARLMASMCGLPFMPLRGTSVMNSDLFEKRGAEGDKKFKVIKDPFYPKQKVIVVPPLEPDVALIHGMRADEQGNIQMWGPIGDCKMAALASKRIIATVEEIVPTEVIRSCPNLTIIPKHRSTAIIEEPWGAHPMDVIGYYDADMLYVAAVWYAVGTPEGQQAFLDEWVHGVKNRKEYITHYVEKFGYENLNKLKAKAYPSSAVNFGSSFLSVQQQRGITEDDIINAPTLMEVEIEND
ncbi:MAG: CoA-transferase [Chloroflexota bacterium]|nr:CoA-transferase [Chloroflexota bacterium]